MEETRQLIKKTRLINYRNLPLEVIDRTKYFILDYIGVAVRGALSDSSCMIQNLFRKIDQKSNGAVVIGTDLKISPMNAAIANGAAAHAVELDDVANAASLHPGAAVITSALATCHMAPCSGKEFIEAVVSGYEVMIKLGIALGPAAHYAQGFHPTATCGTMGSAITTAKIAKLDQAAMTNALGIAGSQAAGSMEYLTEGSLTKRLHPGWAAHSGLMAALLSREGFTGPGTILEGKFGFLHAYSPAPDAGKILKNWGKPYEIMNTSVKPHSCCRYKQGPIDAVLKIIRENGLKPDEIETVTLGVLKAGFPLVAAPVEKKKNPHSIVDAQFSMPFGAAVAILYGKAGLEEYTRENIDSPQVKELMNKVVCVEDPSLEEQFPQRWPAKAAITTKNGQIHGARIEYPKGDPENPLTWNELIDKFKYLTAPVFADNRIEQIIDAVRGMEFFEDLRDFSRLLLNQ
jgi:2-methylcitrate dehydratase PrpD